MKRNIWLTHKRPNLFDKENTSSISADISHDANQLFYILNSKQEFSTNDRNALQRGIATVIHFISLGDTDVRKACGQYLHAAAIATDPTTRSLPPADAVSWLLKKSGIRIFASITANMVSEIEARFEAQIDSQISGLIEGKNVDLLGVEEPGSVQIILQRNAEDFTEVFRNNGPLDKVFQYETHVEAVEPILNYPRMSVFLKGCMVVSSSVKR